MLLNVVNATSGYGRVRIVNGVSFGVDTGEILAIIGRNGVGKTTLMKTLIGGIQLMDGRIEFGGHDVAKLGSAQRARLGIGFVPQGRGIFSRMSVADNLILGKAIGRAQRQPNFERVYRFFPILRERLQQRAGSMSGGQQQQLAIGRNPRRQPPSHSARRTFGRYPAQYRAAHRRNHSPAARRAGIDGHYRRAKSHPHPSRS